MLVCLLSVGLVFSFGLHAIQIEHVHFTAEGTHGGEHTSSISLLGEYMHLADKKLLASLFFASISLWTFLELRISLWDQLLAHASRVHTSRKKTAPPLSRIFDYVRVFLKRGMIHTKAY